jgi:hypothetical protein
MTTATSEDCTEEEDTFGELQTGNVFFYPSDGVYSA